MTWLRNPFRSSPPSNHPQSEAHLSDGEPIPSTTTPPEDIPSDVEAQSLPPTPETTTTRLPPTDRLTNHQIFYIFGLDGVGAMILSGGINFAIAYAMYTTQNTALHPIRLFQLPNTLAGDCAVTIIIQCIITWLVELILVSRDLASGGVAPIGFVPQPKNRLLRWFMFLDTTEADTPGSIGGWVFFLGAQIARAFVVAVVSFCVLWGPCVGILTTVGERQGGDWVYEKTWVPQVFKLILGGVLALLTTPVFAGVWLVKAGWEHQHQYRINGEEEEGGVVG
ncbi:hypothetical protein QBC46DRAFT_93311 [Diplogelasinospora grovesii]|uniref:Uncharacterized protein n=1 Tax=Diplogelasinospora grovesii TaxID=303347 RepID=A0AAN6NIP1_9PEZI|nr:hypothetical protein QBC46DRAFT_93311 [Diplogelasinospora grovesii]